MSRRPPSDLARRTGLARLGPVAAATGVGAAVLTAGVAGGLAIGAHQHASATGTSGGSTGVDAGTGTGEDGGSTGLGGQGASGDQGGVSVPQPGGLGAGNGGAPQAQSQGS